MGRLQFVWLIIIILGIYRGTLGEKPTLIPPKDELILREGDELKLECYSKNTLLHFSFPEYTFMSPRSDHNISVAQNGTLTFLRRKTVFLDTGWYACAAEGVEIDNHFKTLNHTQPNIAWIYVYVSSPEPFADRYYTFPKDIIIRFGDPVIVPCRPTSPDLVVELWKNFQILHRNQQGRLDPKVGFVMGPAVFDRSRSEKHRDIFQCKVNGVEDTYILSYTHASKRRPNMNPAADEIVLQAGADLIMGCYMEPNISFAYVSIYEGLLTDNRDDSTCKKNFEMNGSTLICQGITPGFTKWYGCLAMEIYPRMKHYYKEYTSKDIDWMYVYVESNATKSLGPTSSQIPLKYTDGDSVVVPCRPTSPSFHVKLELGCVNQVNQVNIDCHTTHTVVHSHWITYHRISWITTMLACSDAEQRIITIIIGDRDIVEMDENVRFDPKLGFVMRRGSNLPSICYSCVTDGDSKISTCLEKLPKRYSPPNPRISILPNNNRPLMHTSLDLHCKAESENLFSLEWKIPSTLSKERIPYHSGALLTSVFAPYASGLDIKLTNMTEDDSGKYTCVSRNNWSQMETSIIIQICDDTSPDYSKFSPGMSPKFIGLQGQSVKWKIDHATDYESVIWVSPSKQIIDPELGFDYKKYSLCYTKKDFRGLLEIRNLTFNDSGIYEVHVTSSHRYTFSVLITLDVQGTPIVSMQNASKPYHPSPGQAFVTICYVIGSPKPNITWNFAGHSNSTSNRNSSRLNNSNYDEAPGDRTNTIFSYFNMSTEVSGILSCTACNSFNCSTAIRHIIIPDDVVWFKIIGPEEYPRIGNDTILTCAGSNTVFTNLIWDQNINECCKTAGCDSFYVKEYETQTTIRSVLHIKNLTRCHQRWYSCLGQTMDGNRESSSYYLQIARKPTFTHSNLDQTKIIFDPVLNGKATLNMICCVAGEPEPNLTWFKDDLQLEESHEYHFTPQNCTLTLILSLYEGNGGRYMCRGENQVGNVSRWIDIVVEAKINNLLIVTIALVVFFITVLVTSLFIQKHCIKKSRRKTKEAILERFNEGALDCLDPKLDIVDQAEILPYDEKWEFSRELLKLDKVLGTGAFGIVRKAQAVAICPSEPVTTVAVKMVRPTFKLHQMTALSRELKVLIHLGEHVNIVNLLGACTRNVNYGELIMIVEFCRFGNLQDYLSRSRANFINQIDEVTDEIIGPNHQTHRRSVNQNRATEDSTGDSDTRSSCHGSVSTPNDEADDDEVPSNKPAESGLQSKYECDDQDSILEPISTKDLLCWAWQVARGMRYLGCRKVVHGDLAARNILLADNNVIKICDFGMAKALSKDDDYREAGDTPLPLKWMAVESMKERKFSIQSDVWSYGIVLWEFFSLAETLYPGIHPRFLCHKLINGYRMDRPKYAPKNIYRMMLKCWEEDPMRRPTFAKIERELNNLLDYDVKTYYVGLGALYSDVNFEYMEAGKTDYLTMDPSQIATVSFSKDRDQVEITNKPSDESPDPIGPGLSSTVEINLSTPNTD